MKRAGYQLTEDAGNDLAEIWEYVALRSIDAADRIVLEVHAACERLVEYPGIGHVREDLTTETVKFWSVYSYLVVYSPDTSPLQIVAILHAARDVASLLNER